jgi:hypothetical protein
MSPSDHDQTRVREYLLGHLTEEEQQKIEERFMVEDNLFEELEISKGELIEEYRAGELDRKEHRWFEEHYLASSEGRQRYTFTVALGCLKQPSPMPRRLTLFERFQSFITSHRWALATVASAVLIAVVIVAVQLSRPGNSLAITLNNSVVNRSSSESKYRRIPLKSDIGELRISLLLPELTVRGMSYRVDLDNRGRVESLTPTAHDANSVSVVIPASQLSPGLYSLKLVAIDADGTERRIMGDYFFEISN